MDCYKRVQGSHSPLSPLPPSMFKGDSTMFNYLTPTNATNMKNRGDVLKRRSFTPMPNNGPSPGVSPIEKCDTPMLNLNKPFFSNPMVSPRTPIMAKKSLNIPIIIHSDQSDRSGGSVYFTPPSDITARTNIMMEQCSAPKKPASTPLRSQIDGGQLEQLRSPRYKTAMLTASPPNYSHNSLSNSIENRSLLMNHSSSRASSSMLEILNNTIDIISILKDIHMEKYIGHFLREEIDIRVFCVLSANDLDELGIEKEDRKTFMDAVQFYSDIFEISEENFLEY